MNDDPRSRYIPGITPVPKHPDDSQDFSDPGMGTNLDTLEKVKRWLQHPDHWFTGETFIIQWDGLVPYITRRHAERLRVETHDTGLYEVVLKEQYRLKHKKEEEKREELQMEES